MTLRSKLRAFLELMKTLDQATTLTIHLQREKPRVSVTYYYIETRKK